MQDILNESLDKSRRARDRRNRIIALLLVLSLLVSLDVFWVLRQPGLTLAGDADCGFIEHTHDTKCPPCQLIEHIHTIDCYSDKKADVESQLEWKNIFDGYPYTGDLRQDLVGIAKMQVGYSESKTNFQVGDDGVRRGYNRYGAWYGSPYSDWSAMFVSYCLHYANADETEVPINSGADSMAELWKARGKYAPLGSYRPKAGDLVFFTENRVGVVAEVYNTSFYVICGDVNGEVDRRLLSIADPTVTGWGTTVGTVAENVSLNYDVPPTLGRPNNSLPDISNGPVLQILEGDQQAEQPMRSGRMMLATTSEAINLLEYLKSKKGDYFFTLFNTDNTELPKDGNGNYIVQADTAYRMTLSFSSPEGFLPGTYEYQVPNGLMVDGGAGEFVLQDGTNVGNWVVTNDGLITLNFNEHINSRSDITISATLGINFKEQDEPIDFDGKIFITVEKPGEGKIPTSLSKWGSQGNENNTNGQTDNAKIYWRIMVEGHKDSHIPGSILTDRPLLGTDLGTHIYTESDMQAGISFGVSQMDPITGAEIAWHQWRVYPGDPNLTWTEDGWTYTMPETVRCDFCGEIELGSDAWTYYIDYSSTPQNAVAGTMGYMNRVEIEEQYAEGWVAFTQGLINGVIHKEGSFVADAGGGTFRWEVQASIPGHEEGKKADYAWFIMDFLEIHDGSGNVIDVVNNEMHLSTVTANYHSQTINVPSIYDATENDPFAWHAYWGMDRNGTRYAWQINIVCKCRCNAANCDRWEGWCTSEYWYEHEVNDWRYKGYCQCWGEPETVTFNFIYETTEIEKIEQYGGMDYRLVNRAELYNKPKEGPNGVLVSPPAEAEVDIPTMFQKELTHDFNGYTANYKITVNEGKLVLTNGAPLTIHDVMTPTLAFINGSLVITAEDANGKITTLRQDVDYTVKYDGSGGVKDEDGSPVHVLDIVILHPQPVTYLLDYDATLIMPEQITGHIKYSNSATIHLWGADITDSTVEKVYTDVNIAAKNFKVDLVKADSLTGEPLQGATFGLFNEEGGLVASGVTDANGNIHFKTDVTQGIILREHMLYYMQELQAPPGYKLDKTKHWFCFCDTVDGNCNTFDDLAGDKEVIRIPFEQIGIVHVDNHVLEYDLPETGGIGIYPSMLASVTFIVIPLVYMILQRRKRGRRGNR